MIRAVKLEDAHAICEVYNYYIVNSIATFEKITVTTEQMTKRIQSLSFKLPWIVYEKDQRILGYAYANEWKSRSAYKYSVESTVYIKATSNN